MDAWAGGGGCPELRRRQEVSKGSVPKIWLSTYPNTWEDTL